MKAFYTDLHFKDAVERAQRFAPLYTPQNRSNEITEGAGTNGDTLSKQWSCVIVEDAVQRLIVWLARARRGEPLPAAYKTLKTGEEGVELTKQEIYVWENRWASEARAE